MKMDTPAKAMEIRDTVESASAGMKETGKHKILGTAEDEATGNNTEAL